jgi:hypothetical protein
VNAYELIFYNPSNESQEYSQWIVQASNNPSTEFSYTFERNKDDYQFINGSLGINRNIGAKIRARSDPRLSPGKQLPGYGQLGTGPWAYLEI